MRASTLDLMPAFLRPRGPTAATAPNKLIEHAAQQKAKALDEQQRRIKEQHENEQMAARQLAEEQAQQQAQQHAQQHAQAAAFGPTPTTGSFRCRRCGGAHLTMKCTSKHAADLPATAPLPPRSTKYTLMVDNFPAYLTQDELAAPFARFGRLLRVTIREGSNNVYAFVDFAARANAEAALKAMHHARLEHCLLHVEWSRATQAQLAAETNS